MAKDLGPAETSLDAFGSAHAGIFSEGFDLNLLSMVL